MDIRIITAAFVLGIYLSDTLGPTNIWMFVLSAVPIIFIKSVFTKSVNVVLLITVISFALGAALYKGAYLSEFTDTGKFLGEETVIEGYICDIPYEQYGMMKYTLNATEINNEKVNEKIIVSSEDKYEFGDSVMLVGKLKPIKEQMNENQYNMRNYYKGKGITARITADVSQNCLINVKHFSPEYFANSVRSRIVKLVDEYRTDDYGAVLKAVLTGNYHFLSDDMNNILIRTSTRSLFYSSYVHIMLINLCVRMFVPGTRKKYRDVFTAAFLVLYTLINTAHPSFVRGMMFAAAALGAEHILKRVYYPEIIAAAVLVTCAINPLMAFNSGYVMSVAGTVVIKAFYTPLIGKIKVKHCKHIVHALIMHLIGTVGTIPIAAYYFNSISIYSVIASAVILPVTAVVILVSPIFLLLLNFFGRGYAVGTLMDFASAVMLAVPKITDKFPLSQIFIKSPSLIFITAYGAVVTSAAYLIRRKPILAKRFAAVGMILLSVCAVGEVMRIGTVEVDFVNVGQGDGAVIHSPLGANIIIDGGGSAEYSDYNIGERVFVPYLISIGVTEIDAAFVSHYHKDHIQGVIAAAENLKVKNLYMPDSLPDSKLRAELEAAAEKNGTDIHYMERNTKITFNDGLTIDVTVLDSITNLSDNENDTSLLINVSYGEFNCLFTGDMSSFAERNLIAKGKIPEAEVLKISHHGSKTATSEEFFDKVMPVYSVVSVGEDNTYNLPNDDIMKRIADSCVFRTDLNGNVRILSDKKGNIRTHTLK